MFPINIPSQVTLDLRPNNPGGPESPGHPQTTTGGRWANPSPKLSIIIGPGTLLFCISVEAQPFPRTYHDLKPVPRKQRFSGNFDDFRPTSTSFHELRQTLGSYSIYRDMPYPHTYPHPKHPTYITTSTKTYEHTTRLRCRTEQVDKASVYKGAVMSTAAAATTT